MTSNNLIKSTVFYACLVVFIVSGCATSMATLKKTDLYDVCQQRFQIDNYGFLPAGDENRKNIDTELKQRGKDCGCFYSSWNTSHLYMGLLGIGLMANAAKHCENPKPVEAK